MQNRNWSAAIIIVAAIIFFGIAFSDLDNLEKAIIMIVDLAASGLLLKKIAGLEGYYGFLLLRSKEGLGAMEWFAKHFPRLSLEFANAGLTLCFGLVYGARLFARKSPARFVAHVVLVLLFFGGAWYLQKDALAGDLAATAITIASVFFGLFALGMLSLALHAFRVLTIPTTPAGATLLIPGVTPGIPLVEGIIAIAIIATVHELAHGILFRVEKQEVRHSGALLFGFLPVGAFVEPDEKKFEKLDIGKKRRILVAGSASNLLFFFVFLALLQAPLALAAQTTEAPRIVRLMEGAAASGILSPGDLIFGINGQAVKTTAELSDLLKNARGGDVVTLQTSSGSKTVRLSEGGKLGVFLENAPIKGAELWHSIGVFLSTTFNLTAVLSLALAIINILPLYLTDGHRLLLYELKNALGTRRQALAKAISNAAGIVTLILLIINFLPNLTTL